MPKRIDDIKDFLHTSRRKDVVHVKVKKVKGKRGKHATKFKIRCSKYLYTLTVENQEKAAKLRTALPSSVKVLDIDK